MVVYRMVHRSYFTCFIRWVPSNGKGYKFCTSQLHWPWRVRTTATLITPFGSEYVPITRPILCRGGKFVLSDQYDCANNEVQTFRPILFFSYLQRTQALSLPEVLELLQFLVILRHLVGLFRGIVDTSHPTAGVLLIRKWLSVWTERLVGSEDICVIGREFNIVLLAQV